MAVAVMAWVWSHSRSSHGSRLVLLALADYMRDENQWAWPSVGTLAAKTNLGERSVQTAITDLVKLGELEVGYGQGPKGCHRFRVLMNDPAESAPPQNLHPADPAPPQDFPGNESSQAGAQDPAESAPGAESAPPQNSAATPAESAPKDVKNRKRSSSKKSAGEPDREDVNRLCAQLADRIEAGGSKRPSITDTWRRECRLLLDADKRTEEQVRLAIDWCQGNAFWCSKVMSMQKLREKYDTLRLEAKRERDEANGGRPGRRPGHQPYKNPDDQSAYDKDLKDA